MPARVAGADLDRARSRRERVDQRVGDVADGDDRGDRHAALAGGAVAGTDDRVGRERHVGIREHDRVVLRAAQRLHALAVRRACLVDVLCDRRRADERHGADARMREDRVDRLLVAVDDVEDAVGQARLGQQLGHPQRKRRVALGRLQDEGIAAGERDREHPHRHHRRKVERRDASADADRLPQRPAVDVGPHVLAELALEQMRNAGGELDDLDPAGDRALGVGERLAVLFGDDPRQRLLVLLHELAEAHQHARAAQGRRDAPLGPRGRRSLHGEIDVFRVAERHVANHFARRRIGHFAVALSARGDSAPADPQRQSLEGCQIHFSPPSGSARCCGAQVVTACRR